MKNAWKLGPLVRKFAEPKRIVAWLKQPISSWAVVGLCSALILAAGPLIQDFLAIAAKPAVSIYAARHGDGLIEIAPTHEWFAFAVLEFLPFTALSALLASFTNSRSAFALTFFIISFLTVSISDFVVRDSIPTEEALINISGNFFGLIILSLVSAWSYEYISSFSNPKKRFLHSTLLVLFSAILSLFLIYVSRIFFEPLKQKVELVTSSPSEGFLGDFRKKRSWHKISVPSGGSIKTTGFKDIGGDIQADTYGEFLLSAYINCTSLVENYHFPPDAPTVKLTGKELKFRLPDGGPTNLEVSSSSSFEMQQKFDGGSYWLNSNGGEIEFSKFSSGTFPSIYESSLNIKFDIDGSLIVPMKGRKATIRSRKFTIEVDGKKYGVGFKPVKNLRSRGCQAVPLDFQGVPPTAVIQVPEGGYLFGMRIFAAVDYPRDGEQLALGTLRASITEPNGWQAIRADDFKRSDSRMRREISMFSVSGLGTSVALDDQTLERNFTFPVTGIGEFKFEQISAESIRIYGDARYLWLGQQRLSQTAWETFSWEFRSILITLFVSILSGIFKFLKTTNKRT